MLLERMHTYLRIHTVLMSQVMTLCFYSELKSCTKTDNIIDVMNSLIIDSCQYSLSAACGVRKTVTGVHTHTVNMCHYTLYNWSIQHSAYYYLYVASFAAQNVSNAS